MEKAVVVNEETAPTIIEAEILPDVIIEELPIQPAPVQPKSIQTASVQQTPIQQVPVQPTPIQQTPKPKTTNLFGLIREKNSAEIVDEFSAPNSNENKVNLGEIVRQARETQLAQPLDPGSLDQQPVPVPFAVNRADLIDTAKIETPIIMPTLPEKKNTIKCIHCQTILEVGARFCGECGAGQSTQTKSACKSCGIPIDPSEKFCGECGSSQ
jgi:RNA polymerase subunit RPABC4/transcription elongation factor Spt4